MISIFMLPFMCLSLTQEGAKAKGMPFSVNEITSAVNFNSSKDERGINLASQTSVHNEGSLSHDTFGSAENAGTIGVSDYDLEIRGKTSKYNKRDVYSISVADRTRAHFKFSMFGAHMNGEVRDERGNKLFEFTDDDEKYGPTVLFKKGIYFIAITTTDDYDTDYIISMWSMTAQSSETITIDADMMSKYKALVWESDYVPGGFEPIDGTIVKTAIKPGRRTAWRYTGGFYSCKTDEEFLGRSIYVWSKDVFELLKKDVENYEAAAKEALAKAKPFQTVSTVINYVSTITGEASYVCQFVPGIVSKTASTILGTVSFILPFFSMVVGNGTNISYDLIKFQCARIKGSIDAAVDGTVISIKENATIKLYQNDTQYTKRHIWKLKYVPYLVKDDGSYSVVERNTDETYPTYDMKLHHNKDNEIVSDCQGTFKTYTDINDIKFAFNNEE